MKKIIALLLVVVMAMTIATGCQLDIGPADTKPEVGGLETTPIINETTGSVSETTSVNTTPVATDPENTTPTETTPLVTTPEATTNVIATTPVQGEGNSDLPEVTTPVATTPAATTPVATTPKPTEPVATTPKPTEPVATTPKATTPGHTHSYTGKVTKEATCTASGTKTFTCSCGDVYTETIKATGHNYTTKVVEPTTSAQGYTLYTCSVCGESYKDNYTDKLPEETKPSDEFGGVTPDNISVSNTAGWTSNDFAWWYEQHRDTMTNAQKRAYWIARYDGYDCGVAGHDCRNAQQHVRFTRPCQYCGLTLGCVGRIQTDELGFTVCDDNCCYSYDVKLDPSKYCQTCGKTKNSAHTEKCHRYLADTNCLFCGQPVKANTCHTCRQEDIDNYNG